MAPKTSTQIDIWLCVAIVHALALIPHEKHIFYTK